MNERINEYRESKARKTEIISGDIYAKVGNYERRLNTKNATGIAFCGEVVNLPDYTGNEPWDTPSVNYGVISISGSGQISSWDIKLIWIGQDRNSFKFEGRINGTVVTNQIQVSWNAREDTYRIETATFSPKESQSISQSVTYRIPLKVDRILSVTSNTGKVISYTQPDSNNSVTVRVDSGAVYKTYNLWKEYNESYSGSTHPATSKQFTEKVWNGTVGETMTYTNTFEAQQRIELGSPQVIRGTYDYKYMELDSNNPGSIYYVGQQVSGRKDGTNINVYTDTDEYTEIVDWVDRGYANYKYRYMFRARDIRTVRTRKLTFAGNLIASTRFYLITLRYLGAK